MKKQKNSQLYVKIIACVLALLMLGSVVAGVLGVFV